MKLLKRKIFKTANLWWLALFIITVIFHCNHTLNSDEGVVLEGAWNLINNREIYFDFFEFITPGSFYAVFFVWKIFGVHYWIAKFLAIIIVFLSSVGIYKISRQIAMNNWVYLPPFIFIFSSFCWPIINHNIFNLFFIIWAVYFFIKSLSGYSVKHIVISGFFSGLAIMFLQQKGIIFLLIVLLYLFILFVKEKNYIWLKFCFYYLFSALFPVLLLLIKWPLELLYKNLIEFPLFNYTEVNHVPIYLFLLYLVILSLTIWWFRKNKFKEIWFLFLLQFALLASVLPRPDYYHIYLIIFPLYAIFPIIIEKIFNLHHYFKLALSFSIGMVIFLIVLPSLVFIAIICPPFSSIKDNAVLSYIKDNCPDEKDLYAGPFIPGLYFEARKLNFTPYPFLVTNHQTEEQFIEAKNLLVEYRPTCAVYNFEMVKKFRYNKDNAVDNYIMNNYELAFEKNDILVYKLDVNTR